jgi:hypothetical protein
VPILSQGFAWPGGVFYEGHGIVEQSVVPAQYPVAIAGHPYFIEPSLYRLTHVPLRREARDDTAEPGEQSLNPAGPWRRSQSDWSLGAGQLWLDEQESTRRRFHTSLGIDVFNDRELSLLPETEEKRNSSNTNLKTLRVGTRLYAMDGDTLIFSDGSGSEQDSTWTVGSGWTAATGLTAGTLLDMTYSGAHVYVLASDNNIFRATPGTAAFNPVWFNPATAYTRIFSGLGRLFASAANVLYEISSVPAETAVFTHPFADFTYGALVGTPTGIYFGGSVGSDAGEIRRMVVNSAGTGFDPPVVVAEFDNERVYALAAAGLNMLIGTGVGLRYSPLSMDGAGLDFGPAIEVGTVRDIVIDSFVNPAGQLDTFAYFTWSQINGGTESGLGRVRLTRFTEPNVPAYASDIYTSSGGTVLTVASLSGRRYYGISTDGFKGATVNPVEEGELRTGRIRYGLLDLKTFLDASWRTAPLKGAVEVEIETDDEGVHHVGLQDMMDTTTHMGHVGSVTAEWGELVFMLRRFGEITPNLHFEGNAGTCTTPDHANFAITDLDADITLTMENWTPGGSGTRFLFGQSTVIANIGWGLFLDPTGRLALTTSVDGTVGTTVSATTTNPPEFELGSEHKIGIQLDVDNGAGGRTYNFLVDGALFETITVGATTSIFNSTATLSIGFNPVSPTGDSHVAQATLRASIGGADVANPNFTIQEVGDTSFADTASTPKTWTVNAPATISLVHEGEELSPRLRWWVLRSIPSVEETMQILVPLRLTEKESGSYGAAVGTAFLEELDFLMALSNSKQVVTYQEGNRSYQVYVNNIETNPTRWNGADQGLEGIIMAELHTTTHP